MERSKTGWDGAPESGWAALPMTNHAAVAEGFRELIF